MKPLVTAACLLALFCSEAAPAAAPDGFRESARLIPRAQAISGNAAAVVYCARTYSAWEAKVREFHGPAAKAHLVRGMAAPTASEMYLSRPVCMALESWLRGKPASLWDVGVSAHTLGHETWHLRGVYDEKVAECSALRALPDILRQHFGVKKPETFRTMVAAAKTMNRRTAYVC